MKTPILNQLKVLPDKNITPFHMPGHKRKHGDIFEEIGKYDITEIRGYDNLHDPQGIIKESMEELSKSFHSKKSWYLINGSTCGIQAAIAASCKVGDHIVIGRNCHKAVYHMIELLQLKVHYLLPSLSEKYDFFLAANERSLEQLKEYVKEYDIKAVVITSPTYEGILSDISAMHDILKEYKIPLIVDEAHGAHLAFIDSFPDSAISKGADLVIQSSHKTLPAMTQTALLHLCSDLIDEEKISKTLSYFETSSPSYILMASIEYSVNYMTQYVDKINQYVDNLRDLYTKCGQLKNIHLLDYDKVEGFEKDPSKIVILLDDVSMHGNRFADLIFERYHIEFEMSELSYVIAMTSVMDEKEDYEKLYRALSEIDLLLEEEKGCIDSHKKIYSNQLPNKSMETWQVEGKEKEVIHILEAENRISASYVHLYPPGVPILVPGEKIMKETVENINYYLYNGYCVTGLSENNISVVK